MKQLIRLFISVSAVTPTSQQDRIYLSYLKVLGRWLLSLTPITYHSKLMGLRSLAAYPHLQLLWVLILTCSNPVIDLSWRGSPERFANSYLKIGLVTG